MNSSKYANLLVLASIGMILFLSLRAQRWAEPGGGNLISWDACGYYSYLPAFFFDDLFYPDKTGELATENGRSDGSIFHYAQTTGRAVMRYPMGEAIALLPAFGLNYLITGSTEAYADSYSFACGMWGLVVAIIGIFFLRKTLLRYFSPWTVALLIFTYVFATNYLNYASIAVLHTHNLLFTMYAILCYAVDTHERRGDRSLSYLLGVGMLVGWMTITRPTDALAVMIPLFWGSSTSRQFGDRFLLWMRRWKSFLVLGLGVLMVCMLQMSYWKHATGEWIYNSYQQGLKFSFKHPHLAEYLYGYAKGWFTYTPIMIFSLLGIIALLFRGRFQAILVAIFTVITIYILSSWDDFQYGGSFSQRSIIQSYVLLAFPMAYLIERARKLRWSRWLMALILMVAVYLNITMHYQANFTNYFETTEMNSTFYWRLLGRWDRDYSDRRFLDVNYEMPDDTVQLLKLVYKENFNSFTPTEDTLYYSSPAAYFRPADGERDTLAMLDLEDNVQWVRVKAMVQLVDASYDPWRQIVIEVYQEDDRRRNAQVIKPFRFIDQFGEWVPIYWDLRVDTSLPTQLYVVIYNDRLNNWLFLDDLSIYTSE